MNERIRILAEQAEFSEKDLHIQGDNFQRFAELIVRECALTAGLMEHEGRSNIGAQILDNFGVES